MSASFKHVEQIVRLDRKRTARTLRIMVKSIHSELNHITIDSEERQRMRYVIEKLSAFIRNLDCS